MESIKLNSLTQLKSGGPVMTVKSFARKLSAGNPLTAMTIDDKSQVNCQWFEGSVLSHGTFDAAALVLILEPNKPCASSTTLAKEIDYTVDGATVAG